MGRKEEEKTHSKIENRKFGLMQRKSLQERGTAPMQAIFLHMHTPKHPLGNSEKQIQEKLVDRNEIRNFEGDFFWGGRSEGGEWIQGLLMKVAVSLQNEK